MLRSSAPRLFSRAASAAAAAGVSGGSASAGASAACASTTAGPSRSAAASSTAARSAPRAAPRAAFASRAPRAAAAADARSFATRTPVQPAAAPSSSSSGFVAAARRAGAASAGAGEPRSLNPLPTPAALQQWAASTPLPALPDDVLGQAVTHDSFDLGLTNASAGHNRRLQFLGRRALFLYYHLLSPSSSSAEVQAALHTSHLGETAGRALSLHAAMRWTPARDGDEKTSGLWTIRGSVVEALVGGVYHQHGALAARAFAHAHVFPHLKLQEALRTKVEQLGGEARAQLDALRAPGAASPAAVGAPPPPPPNVPSPAAAKMHGELP